MIFVTMQELKKFATYFDDIEKAADNLVKNEVNSTKKLWSRQSKGTIYSSRQILKKKKNMVGESSHNDVVFDAVYIIYDTSLQLNSWCLKSWNAWTAIF